LFLSGLVLALGLAGIQFSRQIDGRYAGTLSHPNSAATLISLTILVFFIVERPVNRIYMYLVITILLFSLVSTGSLGGAISVMAGATAWYGLKRSGGFSGIFVAILLALSAYFFLTNFTNLGSKLSFLDREGLSTAANSLVATNSGEWRIVNWRLLIERWGEYPIFGHGLGSTSEVVTPLGAPPHSMLIQVLVETGLVGFISSAILFISYFIRLIQNGRYGNYSKAFVVVVFVVSAGVESNLFLYTPTMYFLAIIFGVMKNDPESITLSEVGARQ